MLRAQENTLLQSANHELLNIRQLEMNFLVETFGSIGSQITLLTQFLLTDLAEPYVRSSSHSVVKYAYWIVASLGMSLGMHCVITTAVLNVYGPGYALRGKTG